MKKVIGIFVLSFILGLASCLLTDVDPIIGQEKLKLCEEGNCLSPEEQYGIKTLSVSPDYYANHNLTDGYIDYQGPVQGQIIESNDGYFILSCPFYENVDSLVNPVDYAYEDSTISKFDKNWNLLWTKFLTQDVRSYISSDSNQVLINTKSGMFFVFNLFNSTMNYSNIVLLRFDNDGNILGNTILKGDYEQFPVSIIESYDGSFYLLGNKNNESGDIFVIKFDNTNNIIWQKVLHNENYSFGSNIIESDDGGVIIIGGYYIDESYEYSHLLPQMMIVKLDVDGNLEWQKVIESYVVPADSSAIKLSDGNIVLPMMKVTIGEDNYPDYYPTVIKLNPNGEILWQKLITGVNPPDFSDNTATISVSETNNGGIIVTALIDNLLDSNTYLNTLLLNFDANGEILWQKLIAGSESDFHAYDMIQNSDDKSIIITGYYDFSVLTISLDANGQIGADCGFIRDSAMTSHDSNLNLVDSNIISNVEDMNATLEEFKNFEFEDIPTILNPLCSEE